MENSSDTRFCSGVPLRHHFRSDVKQKHALLVAARLFLMACACGCEDHDNNQHGECKM